MAINFLFNKTSVITGVMSRISVPKTMVCLFVCYGASSIQRCQVMNSLIEIACVTHVSAFFLVIIRNGWSCGWMQNNVTSDSSSSSNSDSDTSSSDARDEEGRRVNGLAEEAEGGEGAVVTEEGPGGRGTPFSAPPGTPPFLWRVQQLDRRMESADLALAIEELGGIPGKPSVHGSGGKLQVHMCGPPSMIDATEAELSALGVPADQVHFERWW